MTAAEREAWLDRLCQAGDPPEEEDEEYAEPLTPEELAEIHEAAADESLAIGAATNGRRGPGMAGSARVFPGESSSPAASFGPGMALDRELAGIGPVDPWLARDLAAAGASRPETTWCITVTDGQGHAVGHGCARPEPKRHRKRAGPRLHGPGPPGGTGNRDGPGFRFAATDADGPLGGYGTWRLRTPGGGPDLIVDLAPISTDPCHHRFQARGHDPGVKLRHLTKVRYATCTGPGCRRPAFRADFEHGGRQISSPAGRSGGRRHRHGSTPPSRRGTQSEVSQGQPADDGYRGASTAGGYRSRTRSADGWEQQIRALPSAGSSTGSGT